MAKPTTYKTSTPATFPLAGATSTQIRSKLVEALGLDLVGPSNDHSFAHELLPQSPRRWYLTGFLVPKSAPKESRRSKDDGEAGESGFQKDGDDQGESQDKAFDEAWAKDEAEAAAALDAKDSKTDYKNRGYRRDPREESVNWNSSNNGAAAFPESSAKPKPKNSRNPSSKNLPDASASPCLFRKSSRSHANNRALESSARSSQGQSRG